MGGEEFPKERIRTALERYRDHQAAGDDMAQAGEELFDDIEDAMEPRPCAPSRHTLLELISINRDVQDIREIEELVLEGPDSEERRKVLRRIDERIEELRSLDAPPRGRSRPGPNPFLPKCRSAPDSEVSVELDDL